MGSAAWAKPLNKLRISFCKFHIDCHTVNFLISATLYFAAALPELAPHAKFQIWIFYIWHMRSYLDIRANMPLANRSQRAGFQTFLSITQWFWLQKQIRLLSFISTRRGGSFGVHASSWWSHKSEIWWNLQKPCMPI